MFQSIKNIYHYLQALLSAIYFNFPSKNLTVIGVTGTDGKTTTVNMIYHILKSNGQKVSMISSVNAQIGSKKIETGFHVTTPSPFQVQKLLRQSVISGDRYFVMEATSHGLDQNRLAFVNFIIAVKTNITEEHLDYHKTWERLAMAKLKLFKNVQYSVLNSDDKAYSFLKDKVSGTIITYSQKNKADISLQNFPVKLKILGDFNISNALAAASVANILKIPKSKIISSLASFEGVAGRMEKVDLGQKFTVIIDFAHTPNSLKNALSALRSQVNPKSKVIAVFGAAGKRDKSKRQKMGVCAAELADISIITAEDPRSEKVEDISSQIAAGFRKSDKRENKDYYQIAQRREAINFAISKARDGDIVGLFGKGHEKSMAYNGKELTWSEVEVAKQAIKRRLNDKK